MEELAHLVDQALRITTPSTEIHMPHLHLSLAALTPLIFSLALDVIGTPAMVLETMIWTLTWMEKMTHSVPLATLASMVSMGSIVG